ncbi:unnamed protein product [Phaeothamnion confervicola]
MPLEAGFVGSVNSPPSLASRCRHVQEAADDKKQKALKRTQTVTPAMRRPWAATAACSAATAALTSSLLLPFNDEGFTMWDSDPSKTLGAKEPAPSVSFEEWESRAPTLTAASSSGQETMFPRGRREPLRSYCGLEMWNSRGNMDHRRAILAMLGDEYAYYETPLFTAYKLLALGRIHELGRAVRPSASDHGWAEEPDTQHGYDQFFAEAAETAFSGGLAALFPRAATEAEAVAVAKALVDEGFYMEADIARDRYLGFDFEGLKLAAAEGWAPDFDPYYRIDDPYFMLFSSLCYRKAAALYGNRKREGGGGGGNGSYGGGYAAALGAGLAVLVLSPAARLRGLDYSFFRLQESLTAQWWGERVRPATRLTQRNFRAMATAAEPGICLCERETDFTEIITPGYQRPQDIEGLERGAFAFYKVGAAAGPVTVICLRNDGRCVSQPEPGGPFYFCGERECAEDPDSCGPPPIVALEPPVVVPVLAAFCAVPARSGLGGGSADSGAAATAAVVAAREVASEALVRVAGGKAEAAGGQPQPAAAATLAARGLPPSFWLSLHGLRFTEGGEGASNVVAAVYLDTAGATRELAIGAADVERPDAATVLRQRAAVS